MAQLPQLSELTDTQALIQVDGYEESLDMFACTLYTAAQPEGQGFMLPAMLLPMLVHQYGEPDEFVSETFLCESMVERLTRRMVDNGWANVDGTIVHRLDPAEHYNTWEDAIEAAIDSTGFAT